MRARWATLAACLACGSCDGKEIVLGGTGATTTPGDASGPATFNAPEEVTELGADGADDDKPTLTSDRLELYFLSTRDGGPGGGDVWRSTRNDPAQAWGAPALVAEVSSESHEKSPAVSADGLTLWVASDRDGGQGGLDIWVSTRSDRSSSWSAPSPVAALNSAGDEIPRPPGQGQLVMPIGVRAPSASEYQIAFASRPSVDGAWGTPALVSEVDTANTDVDGFLDDDGLVLHFSSDRRNEGDQDLFVASRAALGGPFGGFTALDELNSSHDDRDPWLAADGSEIYFSSDRNGTLKIYRATRLGSPP